MSSSDEDSLPIAIIEEPGTDLADTKRQRAPARREAQAATPPSCGGGEERQKRDDDLIGELVADRYRVLRLLGTGGMGAVYEAENEWTARAVAIKVLRPELSLSRDLVARF